MSKSRPSAPLFVPGSESLLASSASFPTAGWGMRAAASAPSSSRGGCLTLRPCSSVGFHPRKKSSFSKELFMHCPSVDPFHRVGPSGIGSSSVGSSLHMSCQDPAPAQAPCAVTASFGHAPAPAWAPFGRSLLLCSPPLPKWCHTKQIRRGNGGCKCRKMEDGGEVWLGEKGC